MKRRAFTLIELLVVIAIIAILAAILFPVFAKAREKARQSSCQSNVKQMSLGILQYAQDYDERYPWMWQGGGNHVHVPVGQTMTTQYDTWADLIYPYCKNGQMFMCPSEPYTQAQMPYNTFPFSYMYNGSAGTTNTGGTGGPGYNSVFGYAMSQVVTPSTTVLLTDGYTMDGWWYAADWVALMSGSAGPGVAWTSANWSHVRRHNDGENVAYADGHVKWMSKEDASHITVGADPD